MTLGEAALLAYAILSRLAYVLYVGRTLRREERAGSYARAFGPAQGFRRFRRRAAWVMNHDAAVFVVLCVATGDTLHFPGSRLLTVSLGALLVVIGLGVKLWAARTLGVDAYYWRNFFEPPPAAAARRVASGPYRFAANPMYTIGYLQTYGLALITDSGPGLAAALFSHATILAFYYAIERPHFRRLIAG